MIFLFIRNIIKYRFGVSKTYKFFLTINNIKNHKIIAIVKNLKITRKMSIIILVSLTKKII